MTPRAAGARLVYVKVSRNAHLLQTGAKIYTKGYYKMKKGNKYLTLTQRRRLEDFLMLKLPKTQIAEKLGVNISTVYREIKRGECEQRKKLYDIYGDFKGYKTYKIYSADKAEEKYRVNITAKGAPLKLGNDFEFVRYVENRILDGVAPSALAGEMKRLMPCQTVVSKTTLYRYIRMGMFLNVSMKNCPVGQRRKHYAKTTVKRPPKGTSIEQRPAEILARNTFGHWEMDCVVGRKQTRDTLLVFSERLTRYEIIIKMPNRKAETVVKCINKLERRFGKLFRTVFKSITVDNGVEFSDFKGLEKSIYGGKRTNVYYCHPYTSCERGTNERINRDIRRKFPKGTDFTIVTDNSVKLCADWVNNYPREIFGFATAAEKFREQLLAL